MVPCGSDRALEPSRAAVLASRRVRRASENAPETGDGPKYSGDMPVPDVEPEPDVGACGPPLTGGALENACGDCGSGGTADVSEDPIRGTWREVRCEPNEPPPRAGEGERVCGSPGWLRLMSAVRDESRL